MCSLSALNGGWPLNNLLIIANKVSSIGILNIDIGTKNDINAGPLNSSNVIIAIINPRNVAQSPANILAGLKLCNKNPKVEPSISNVKIITRLPYLPWKNPIIAIVVKNIIQIPLLSPSSPSIKFIMLAHATINNIVIGDANIPKLSVYPKALIWSKRIPP